MAVIGGNLAFGIQWRHFTTSRDSNVDVTSTTSFYLIFINHLYTLFPRGMLRQIEKYGPPQMNVYKIKAPLDLNTHRKWFIVKRWFYSVTVKACLLSLMHVKCKQVQNYRLLNSIQVQIVFTLTKVRGLTLLLHRKIFHTSRLIFKL